MIIAGTGHRPPKLSIGYDPGAQKRLTFFVRSELELIEGVTTIVSGFALGFDQALAEAAVQLGVPFVAALPFQGMDRRWPEESRRRFHLLLQKACDVRYVGGGGTGKSTFVARDKWMVDYADQVLALYDGNGNSGTAITVEYALAKGKPVSNLWDAWRAEVSYGG